MWWLPWNYRLEIARKFPRRLRKLFFRLRLGLGRSHVRWEPKNLELCLRILWRCIYLLRSVDTYLCIDTEGSGGWSCSLLRGGDIGRGEKRGDCRWRRLLLRLYCNEFLNLGDLCLWLISRGCNALLIHGRGWKLISDRLLDLVWIFLRCCRL